MRALFVSNDPTLFTAESASRDRMRRYAAAIGELHVVSAAPEGSKPEQEGPLFLHPVARGPFRIWRMRGAAHRIVREYAIEVVSAQDPFEYGRIARASVRGTRARFHLQVHTDFLSPDFAKLSFANRVRVWLADRLLPEADGIRAVSRRVQAGLVARYGDRIVEPSILPIAPSAALPPVVPLPALPFSFTLLSVGRLEREKRIADAIAALAIVRGKYPGTGLVVVGSGREERALKAQARSLGLDRFVAFLGSRADAAGLMRSANALVQPSAYEGYGRTLVEAALARLPIVSTDTGIIGEVLVPEREALVAEAGNPASLADQIVRLIEDNQLRRVLAVNAEAAVLAHLGAYQNLAQLVAEDMARAGQPGQNLATNAGVIA